MHRLSVRGRTLVLLPLLLVAAGAPRVWAQSPEIELTSPAEGAVVSGLVTITGSAAQPAFVSYAVSFGFDPNPTNSWFPIGQASDLPVTQDGLVEWDTTAIADGAYMLRLQVFTQDSTTPVEVITRGVVVQNSTPTPTASPAPPTDTPQPSPTSPVVLPPSATAPPVAATASAATSEALAAPAPAENPDDIESGTGFANYGSAFCRGAAATFGLFLLLWLYGRIRGVLRPRIRRWLRRTLSDMRRP